MGLNGMAVLLEARKVHQNLFITETHPKILYHHWTGKKKKYNYVKEKDNMDEKIYQIIGCRPDMKNDHEWDAVASAYAALCAVSGEWTHDLLKEELEREPGQGRLVYPVGEEKVHYMWPV